MKNDRISIIVPVYRVERYLPRCIESILAQSYENFELLLVDDGSPDRSGKICDDYAKTDSRIRVLHKENGGVSSARNQGIELACGKYITFVDSDDFLPVHALESLINAMDDDVQLVMGSYVNCGLSLSKIVFESKQICLSCMDADAFVNFLEACHTPWGKLYCREVIASHALTFRTDIRYGEDALFLYQYLGCVSGVATTDAVVYHYNCLNTGAASKKYYAEKREWLLLLQKEQEALVKRYCQDTASALRFLSHSAWNFFYDLVQNETAFSSPKEAVLQIRADLAVFDPYLLLGAAKEALPENQRALYEAVCHQNAEEIYRIQKKQQKKKRLVRKAKRFLAVCMGRYLETKRDRLIPMKKRPRG